MIPNVAGLKYRTGVQSSDMDTGDGHQDASTLIDSRRYDAVVFDMDGVITNSAALHAAAWKQMFDEFLKGVDRSSGANVQPFTESDYLSHVDGKPRFSGVADFLRSRGITLPAGERSDPPEANTISGLGNRKDRLFMQRVHNDGVPAFASTIALVRQLHAAGIRTAVFSASRNCADVLAAAGVGELFPVRVDGVVAEELGLAGKPDPAMLVEATHRLQSQPDRTVVVEDAEAGVAAGRAGGFGMVIGIDRVGKPERLAQRGADVVVSDLAEVRARGGYRRVSEVPDAFAYWPRIADRIGTGEVVSDKDSGRTSTKDVVVLLDFDGTLSEIVADPAAATMRPDVERALTALAQQTPVAVVSGRDLADLRKRVPVPGIWYAGSHGFELVAPDGTRHMPDVGVGTESVMADAAGELDKLLSEIPGVLVEPKRFGVTVHHRNVAAAQVPMVVATVHEVGSRRGLRVTNGRKVNELRPNLDWDKGRALDWIVGELDVPALPIYLGDDLTDEDAFDAVAADGIGVVVRSGESGDRSTAAGYALDSVPRVGEFLDRLADVLSVEESSAASPSWVFAFDGYDPATEQLREALCTVGNGYLGSRGAVPESHADERHYPGTYVAGLYNRLVDEVAGRSVDNESLVNIPNWLPVTWKIDDGPWFTVDDAQLVSYRQEFDLRSAVLRRTLRYQDEAGRTTEVVQRRFAAMHLQHVCALQTSITAENWSGRLSIRSTVDTAVGNTLVRRYRDLSGRHLDPVVRSRPSSDTVLAVVRTNQSRIPIALAARTTLRKGAQTLDVSPHFVQETGEAGEDLGEVGLVFEVATNASETVTMEKTVTVFTGRDHAVAAPDERALAELAELGDFATLLAGHTAAWDHLWARLRLDLGNGGLAVRTLRLHLLHLVQTLSPHAADLDVGVPARGLHGEAYRGHVFWDELLVLPVLNVRFPVLTRALLMYRYRRLPQARRLARERGCAGALFPWQSGTDGREESQQWHLNPRSGNWNPDLSRLAVHAGIAVAYNVWQYYQVTADLEFLTEYGAEMLVETARFWASSARYDPADDRYHLRGVIGPDEFHSGYPDQPYGGIDDNAYTNVMAAWVIRHAQEALRLLAPRARVELLESLQVAPSEPVHWTEVADRMFVPFHDGVISQFAGYDKLAELDWEQYRQRYGDISRMDRILEAEGDDVNRYRVAKQADVLMLLYLLSAEELRELLGRMGYGLPPQMVRNTVQYYLNRTSHGSTLSSVVHSWVLARANRERAMKFFGDVLVADVADIQGGTTAEGIHMAAMAGSVDLLQRCFTGLEVRGDRLLFNPCWPRELGPATFPVVYRGHRLTIRVDEAGVEISSDPGTMAPVEVECNEQVTRVVAGTVVQLPQR